MRHRRPAFTLIELLVVISIIALLIAMLLPSLNKARDKAREVVCASSLSGFGKGFLLYANANRDYLSSGSFDPEVSNGRDGPVDKVGWIRDLVKFQYAEPARQLCPANLAKYNQKLRPGAAGQDSYTEQEAIELIEKGYNSNYTQSWYMARTQWDQNKARSSKSPLNVKRTDTCVGPLRSTAMVNVSASTVPLLGDGRTDSDENLLGERCVKSMTDGPFGGPFGIQSYADFGPAHGVGSWIRGDKGHNKIRAEVLFGDGHVGAFQDNDRDGEFGINSRVNPNEQLDLSPAEVFDGILSIGRRSRSRMRLE